MTASQAARASEPAPVPASARDETRTTSRWRETLRNVLRQRSAVVGLAILAVLAGSALFAGFIAPYSPDDVLISEGARQRMPPCIHLLGCPESQPQVILGTDGNVRDVFSRALYGGQISLTVGLVTVVFAIFVGGMIGAVSGYAGGWLDNLLMRLMDFLIAFPALLLAIVIVTVLGRSLNNAMLAVGIVAIPIYARVMRSSVLSVREQDYVTAARALGESGRGILFRRIAPNSMTPMVVQGTLGVATAILEVAALSFLGLGAAPNIPEWGNMIGLERNQLFSAPHLILVPGLLLTLTVLAFNLLGDGLRDALDPRLNR
ncbi:MAG: ABC transporter permease [Chloroflexota bacterium]|nr:ABC transporter permease [Chloroflexota bacterium]